MILSIILILLLGLIAFFQYTQGLFSATVTAICAGVAALSAFAFHEQVAAALPQLGSYGNALALVALFAVLFLVLRFLIDNFFDGNVRYPVALDKVGAGLMGVVAGFFATGVIGVAAQELPFGPSIAMFSRYEVEDRETNIDRRIQNIYKVRTGNNASDVMIYSDVVTAPAIGETVAASESTRQNLWLPVDTWFVGLAGKLSNEGGSLSGPIELGDVYPGGSVGFTDTLFARRLGLQPGAQRTATTDLLDIAPEGGIFRATTGEGGQFAQGVPQLDAEDRAESRGLEPDRLPGSGKTFLVIRVLFDDDAENKGGYVHFGPSNFRLVAGGEQYFPIGTMESGTYLMSNAPDDFIFAQGGVDLVFEVNEDVLASEGSIMADGAFLEFKEQARVPLDDFRVSSRLNADGRAQVLRKRVIQEKIGQRYTDGPERYTTVDGFNELRATVPDAPAVPEEPDASADDAADGDDPVLGEERGILDNIKERNDEFNEQGGE